MNELSELILKDYQVRRTKKQKLNFINKLKEYYPELKIEEGGFLHNRNIVFGDIDNAKVVVTAHYDTCAVLPFPNFITPCNIFLYILYNILLTIIILLPSIIISVIAYLLTNDGVITYYAAYLSFIASMLFLLVGIPNKHTANDNTSGVISIIELMDKFKGKKDIAYVLFDNEENGLFGSMFFASKHKSSMKNKLLINLDCVADGDNLLIVIKNKYFTKYKDTFAKCFKNTNNKKVYIRSTKNTLYPSDQFNFKNSAAFAFLNKNKLGLYMDKIHTKRDTIFDRENVKFIVDGFSLFIGEI